MNYASAPIPRQALGLRHSVLEACKSSSGKEESPLYLTSLGLTANASYFPLLIPWLFLYRPAPPRQWPTSLCSSSGFQLLTWATLNRDKKHGASQLPAQAKSALAAVGLRRKTVRAGERTSAPPGPLLLPLQAPIFIPNGAQAFHHITWLQGLDVPGLRVASVLPRWTAEGGGESLSRIHRGCECWA